MMPMRVSRWRVIIAVRARERKEARVWSKGAAVVGVSGRRGDGDEVVVLRLRRVQRPVGVCLLDGSGMMWRRVARRVDSQVMLV